MIKTSLCPALSFLSLPQFHHSCKVCVIWPAAERCDKGLSRDITHVSTGLWREREHQTGTAMERKSAAYAVLSLSCSCPVQMFLPAARSQLPPTLPLGQLFRDD